MREPAVRVEEEPGETPEAPPARRRFVRDVLLPFAGIRVALSCVAWFGVSFSTSWHYPVPFVAERNWAFTPIRLLDLWGRWDTHWYLDIALHGYRLSGPLRTTQSNVAFFPLYPALVAGLHRLLPGAWRGEQAAFLVALFLSNALALAGLALVHRFVRETRGDPELARRTVLYLLLFPAGFFLSCAYSESLFLALLAGAFLLARRGRYAAAGTAGLLLALARPAGILIVVPLAIAWLEGEKPRDRRAGAAVLVLPAVGLAAHAAHLAVVTKDPLALFRAQTAWGRALSPPWVTLFTPRHFHWYMGPLEIAVLVGFAALGVALAREGRRAESAFVLVSLAPVLLSGTLESATRFVLVAFPAFIALARMGARPRIDRTVIAVFAATQALLFFAWSRFYWVS